MDSDLSRQGSCLCGAVRILARSDEKSLGACHCAMCRKWNGGPFMELECGSAVVFEGAENISTYSSSEWAERGFCKNCGSHIFMKFKDSDEYGIAVGLFDSDVGINFDRQVFYDKKPPYYNFANETRNITSDYIYKHFPQCRDGDT